MAKGDTISALVEISADSAVSVFAIHNHKASTGYGTYSGVQWK